VRASSWPLETDPAQPTDPVAREHGRDGRERHRQRLGDLGGRDPQVPQRGDYRHPLGCRAVGHSMRRGGAIQQTLQSLATVTTSPLARGAR
jgi:hypothetical protein